MSKDKLRIQIWGHDLDYVEVSGPLSRPSNQKLSIWDLIFPWERLYQPCVEWANICGANSNTIYECTADPLSDVFWHILALGEELEDYVLQPKAQFYWLFQRAGILKKVNLTYNSLPMLILSVLLLLLENIRLLAKVISGKMIDISFLTFYD